MLTKDKLKISLSEKQPLIRRKLNEFQKILRTSDDKKIFEELVFCIFTAGTSARMGLNAIERVKNILLTADKEKISSKLRGFYRFPNTRAEYVVHTRKYLVNKHSFKLKDLILSFKTPMERRDYFAINKNIKGIGFKESSHFLRNIGFSGYAILDKHVLNCLVELKIIGDKKPPNKKEEYVKIENKLKKFALKNSIDFDEIDLLLWSEKTGEILK